MWVEENRSQSTEYIDGEKEFPCLHRETAAQLFQHNYKNNEKHFLCNDFIMGQMLVFVLFCFVLCPELLLDLTKTAF